ncbi:MAG: hypothetical protein EZS28_046044 [Streblomastix strix]|uniref:Uncharacterized protein n=1 Tax=Streblomastix strix TaxID=222440 RepID=A0A5J4TK54_9EUKA|nr:MAG: hypothetical protein EZS28_046044 [Streblomastix strix]
MMKKDAEVILTEVIAFHTRQINLVASVKSRKACLTTMLSLIYKENLASSTTSKLINKALINVTISQRRYQTSRISKYYLAIGDNQNKKNLNNYDLQVKLASLLISVFFIRPNEIAEVRLQILEC